MIYLSFFGFNEEPFGVTPDPKFLYMSKGHEEAISHLRFGIEQSRGFIMLTGEIGSGKTTIIRYLLGTLDGNTHTSMVLNPKVEPIELLKLIVHDFGIRTKAATVKDLMDSLNEFLLECYDREERAVLIIDEAQEMPLESLEFMRLLSNFETDTHKLLQVVLVGQPELKEIISGERLRQLNQRIAVRYHLDPLGPADAEGYMRHRLKVAGSATLSFPPAGLRAIYRASRGVPRLINVYADRSLMLAYAEGKPTITNRLVRESVREISPELKRPGALKPVAAALSVILAVAGLVLLTVRTLDFKAGPVETVKPKEEVVSVSVEPAVPPPQASINLSEGIYTTTAPELTGKACLLTLLELWGETGLNIEAPETELKKKGYSVYAFKDVKKLMRFKMPVLLDLKGKSVVLRWVAGENALVMDPLDGKKIMPFKELSANISGLKLIYKGKAGGEEAVMRAKTPEAPSLIP